MKFSKEFLQERVGEGALEAKIVGKRRWSIEYAEIFEHEGKFYRTRYNVGATEMQDESPYENDADEIECPEVHKVSKMVDVWEPVPA